MARFPSREEYQHWRAGQQGFSAPPPSVEPAALEPAAEQVYDGPPPGSPDFVDRSLQHAGLATDREKNLAMLCHLTALLGFLIPFGNLIGPVVVWMTSKADSSFVDEHGKASLNFQISLTVFFLAAAVVAVFAAPIAVILVLAAAIVVLYGIVMIVVNAVRAHNGDEGGYALSTQFLS